jgi:hypothetical protein
MTWHKGDLGLIACSQKSFNFFRNNISWLGVSKWIIFHDKLHTRVGKLFTTTYLLLFSSQPPFSCLGTREAKCLKVVL